MYSMTRAVFSVTALVLLGGVSTSGASADVVTLDFASGDSAGFDADPRYEVSTWNMNWTQSGYTEEGFGTEGVLYAWGDGASIGSIDVHAAEGQTITGMDFDLSGYGDYDAKAAFSYFIDTGGGWDRVDIADSDRLFDFEGNTSLFEIMLPEFEANSFRIVINNYVGATYVGLDNVSFSVAPAPGALALLGLAGLAGGSRRRG